MFLENNYGIPLKGFLNLIMTDNQNTLKHCSYFIYTIPLNQYEHFIKLPL
jgi:hypothetical protein